VVACAVIWRSARKTHGVDSNGKRQGGEQRKPREKAWQNVMHSLVAAARRAKALVGRHIISATMAGDKA